MILLPDDNEPILLIAKKARYFLTKIAGGMELTVRPVRKD
jgi:hypothetical protein